MTGHCRRLQHVRIAALPTAVAAMVVLCLGPAFSATEGQTPTFTFNPPDGTAWVQTITTSQTIDFGAGHASTRETELRTQTVLKRTSRGYQLATTCVFAKTRSSLRQPQDTEERLMDAIKGVTLTYEVDRSEGLVDVAGWETLLKRAKAALPPEAVAIVGKALEREALLAGERAEWDRSVTKFLGRRAAVGEVWLGVEDWLGPSAQMVKYYAANKVVGKAKVGGRECLRVDSQYHTDPERLREFLGDKAEDALSGAAPLGSQPTLEGTGRVIVDPATLLWYSASFRRSVQTEVTVPGQGTIPVTIRQSKQYQYDYQKPK
jgi:hypothetical protein